MQTGNILTQGLSLMYILSNLGCYTTSCYLLGRILNSTIQFLTTTTTTTTTKNKQNLDEVVKDVLRHTMVSSFFCLINLDNINLKLKKTMKVGMYESYHK